MRVANENPTAWSRATADPASASSRVSAIAVINQKCVFVPCDERPAGILPAEPSRFCRQDAGSTLRFMESPLSFFRMHWGHEPCLVGPFISNELRVRFMESHHFILKCI